jgi:hypothetical protein
LDACRRLAPCHAAAAPQVIVERAERSDVPDIDKKKCVFPAARLAHGVGRRTHTLGFLASAC